MQKSRLSVLLSILFAIAPAWSQDAIPFDGSAAFNILEKQCNFGPRNPGSTGYYECRDWLTDQLLLSADTVVVQPFTRNDPFTGQPYDMENLMGVYGVKKPPGILLAAHWDTRPWADEDQDDFYKKEPILGANDGASGVAVLLQIGKMLNEMDLPYQVVIVLLDGEDLGQPGRPESYAQGSEELAKNPPIPLPPEGILLDMIGDSNLHISREQNSYYQNPDLVKSLWDLAAQLNLKAFNKRIGPNIYDDHIPLYRYAGIKMIDLIDFDYPDKYTNYWHTHWDTPEHCSAKSLDQVGTLIINFLADRSRRD